MKDYRYGENIDLFINKGEFIGKRCRIVKHDHYNGIVGSWICKVVMLSKGYTYVYEDDLDVFYDTPQEIKEVEEVEGLAYDICKEDICLAESEVSESDSDSECSDEPPFIITPIKNRRTNSINLSYE